MLQVEKNLQDKAHKSGETAQHLMIFPIRLIQEPTMTKFLRLVISRKSKAGTIRTTILELNSIAVQEMNISEVW